MKTVLGFLLFAAALSGAVVVGCGTNAAVSAAEGGNCPEVGTKVCSDDPTFTRADFDRCSAQRNDAKCGGAFQNVIKCEGAHAQESCTNNKLDQGKIDAACKRELDA